MESLDQSFFLPLTTMPTQALQPAVQDALLKDGWALDDGYEARGEWPDMDMAEIGDRQRIERFFAHSSATTLTVLNDGDDGEQGVVQRRQAC